MWFQFVLIICESVCLRIFGSAKRGEWTLIWRFRPNFSPKLPTAYTGQGQI